jgi:hypothetical protein
MRQHVILGIPGKCVAHLHMCRQRSTIGGTTTKPLPVISKTALALSVPKTRKPTWVGDLIKPKLATLGAFLGRNMSTHGH